MKCHVPKSVQTCFLCLVFAQNHPVKAQQPGFENGPQPAVILGVLEDLPGNYAGEANFRVVRAVFQKRGNEWHPFPTDCSDTQCLKSLTNSYPQKVTWTIAFDGKNMGQLEAHTPADFRFYSQVGIEEITSSGPVPTIGKRAEKYAGWLFQPVFRPLTAVSHPNFKDPDAWKPAHLSPEQIDAVRKQFRDKFPEVSNCRNPEEDKLTPWRYRDEDIEVNSTYSSKTGWSLVELGLTGYACDGPVDEHGPFVDQWYIFEPSGKSRLLGADMWLVDAGDYDGDGKSEVLFAVSGYNLGGYRLFYRDFSRTAEFLFSYH